MVVFGSRTVVVALYEAYLDYCRLVYFMDSADMHDFVNQTTKHISTYSYSYYDLI